MCYFPIIAEIDTTSGRIKFTPEGNLKLPCGKCKECISKRAVEWGLRARHEISCHKENCFLTLTYDNENVPPITDIKEEFQKFIKRLRKKIKSKIRYMVSHEYGAIKYRPHHHAIIFGYDPENQKFLKQTKSKEKIFTSEIISKIWGKGYHSIGTANEKTAYYIASYALKGSKHTYTDINGEIKTISDCMDVSKRPAIGLEYFKKNYQQLIDTEIILPRYYRKKLEKIDEQLFGIYEDNLTLKFKIRDSYELYAKYMITKQIQFDNEYRTETKINNFTNSIHETILKQNLDKYNDMAIKPHKEKL